MSIWWFLALVAFASGLVYSEKPHWGVALSVWVGFVLTLCSMTFCMVFFPESFSN